MNRKCAAVAIALVTLVISYAAKTSDAAEPPPPRTTAENLTVVYIRDVSCPEDFVGIVRPQLNTLEQELAEGFSARITITRGRLLFAVPMSDVARCTSRIASYWLEPSAEQEIEYSLASFELQTSDGRSVLSRLSHAFPKATFDVDTITNRLIVRAPSADLASIREWINLQLN